MIITTATTISFDPVKDYELHKTFVETEDLSGWKMSAATSLISYTKEWSAMVKEGEMKREEE